MLKLHQIPSLIDFRTYIKDEISEIETELTELQFIYERIANMTISDEIKEGSRVTFYRGINQPVNGRVITIKNGKYSVHRDGFAGIINANRGDLTNLSIGPIAEIERQIWVLENRKTRIEGQLKDSDIPAILLANKHNFIQVIDLSGLDGSYQIITFVCSTDKLSYKLKLPKGLINAPGYYQLNIENNDIKAVLKSTREVFENSAP